MTEPEAAKLPNRKTFSLRDPYMTSNIEEVPVESPQVVQQTSSSTGIERGPLQRLVLFLLQPSIVVVLLTVLVLSRGITQGEFFFYGDEMRHAMNGAFFRDLIADHPFHHPLQYAYEYYSKYPATAFPHWPPIFYLCEGVFFLLFGLSPWVSRLTVMFFALLVVYFWYRIVESLSTKRRAFFAALLLMSMPFVLLYERVTMLEIPALATCMAALYFWLRFAETDHRRYLWILTGVVAAAFLTSQNAIFLILFVPLDLMMERRWGLLKRWDVWLALLISIAAVLPWYVLTQRTERGLGSVVLRASGHDFNHLNQSANYTFYLSQLYRQLGPILLLLSCAGLLFALVKPVRANRFMVLWVVSGYLSFSLIPEKDARHTIMWVPPLVCLALVAVERFCVRRVWSVLASSALVLTFLIGALRSERPIVSGAKEAAQYVVSLPGSDIVYFQGRLDGDFIFFIRKFDPQKRRMVAREKQVVISYIGFGPRNLLRSEAEILKFFKSWGIRYAVVDDREYFPGLGRVRELLMSNQFELLRTFPIHSNQPNLGLHQIQVFRYRGDLPPTGQTVAIPMYTLQHAIPANLTHLVGHPWPN